MAQRAVTKVIVLDELSEGNTLAGILRRYGMGRQTLTKWRKADPVFDEGIKEIMGTPEYRKKSKILRKTGAVSGLYVNEDASWKDLFLLKYGDTLDRCEAADFARIPVTIFIETITPEHSSFDLQFKKRVDDLELRHRLYIEDSLKIKAIKEGDTGVQKFLVRKEDSPLGLKSKKKEAKTSPFDQSAMGAVVELLKGLQT